MRRADRGAHAVTDAGEVEARLARALSERDDVVFAYLFGSVATGRAHARSDVDVAVWLEDGRSPDPGRDPLIEIIGVVTSALKRDDVDLVVLNSAPLRLAFDAIHGRLLLDRDEERRVVIEAALKSRYHDRVPYHRRHLEHEGRGLAESGFS